MTDEDGYLELTIRWNPKAGHLSTHGSASLTNADIALMLMLATDAFTNQLRTGAAGPDNRRGIQVNIKQPGLQVRRIP